MVHVDQHPVLGIRSVEIVVNVRAARLFLLVSADVHDGVVLAWAQIDHVYRERAREEEMRKRMVEGEIL